MAAAANRARAAGGSIHDRLSALPNDLLRCVLSLLPAQQAVQTTALSRRWTDLWRSAPGINLDMRDFRRTRVLYDVEDPDPSRYQLPHLSFPAGCGLKRLELTSVSLDDSFAERLRSWCPDLEDLVLDQCSIRFSRIESDKLKNLVVQYCTNEPAAADVFVIRAPRVASLRLDNPYHRYENGVSLYVRNSLERAFISIGPGEFPPRSEARLIGSLCGVTNLELKGFQTMAMLDKEFDKVSIFGNMRTLCLDSCFYNPSNCDLHKFKAVMRFLQKAPNLEKLTLKNFRVSQVVEPVEYPKLENLRTLFLNKCDLHDNFGILQYCLRNSPNLEPLQALGCFHVRGRKGQVKEDIFSS
ncbi:MEIOTIC F-BOX protein MOF [Setaria viridis]|nr:putative F-box/FBD/LRR-repeat protein At5g56810 [Setaria viridis]